MQPRVHILKFHLGILRHGRTTEAIGRGQIDVARERHGARHAEPGRIAPLAERPGAEDVARARNRAGQTRIPRRLDAELAASEDDIVGNDAVLAVPPEARVDVAGKEKERPPGRHGDRGHLRRRERLSGRVRRIEDRQVVVRQRDRVPEAEGVLVDRDDRIVGDLKREIRRLRVEADLPVEHDLAVHALVEGHAVRHVERGVVGRPVLVGSHHERVRALDVERGVVLEMQVAEEAERRAVEPREVERHDRRRPVGRDDRAEEPASRAGRPVGQRDRHAAVAAEVEAFASALVRVAGRAARRRSAGDRLRRSGRDRLPRHGTLREQRAAERGHANELESDAFHFKSLLVEVQLLALYQKSATPCLYIRTKKV